LAFLCCHGDDGFQFFSVVAPRGVGGQYIGESSSIKTSTHAGR
jgi:hypothetical protein